MAAVANTQKRQTSLNAAVRRGDIAAVARYVNENYVLSPRLIRIAAERGKADMVTLLIKLGATYIECWRMVFTLRNLAALGDVRTLEAVAADDPLRLSDSAIPCIAAGRGHLSVLKLLDGYNLPTYGMISVNVERLGREGHGNRTRVSPEVQAAKSGKIDVLKFIRSRGCTFSQAPSICETVANTYRVNRNKQLFEVLWYLHAVGAVEPFTPRPWVFEDVQIALVLLMTKAVEHPADSRLEFIARRAALRDVRAIEDYRAVAFKDVRRAARLCADRPRAWRLICVKLRGWSPPLNVALEKRERTAVHTILLLAARFS